MSQHLIDSLLRRFGGTSEDMLRRVLMPYRLRIEWLDSKPTVLDGIRFVRFRAEIPADVWSGLEPGVSGKVVPASFVNGSGSWKELCKARIHQCTGTSAEGELHLAGTGRLDAALLLVRPGDYIEIDPFGVTSKVESALAEAAFFSLARSEGWNVSRMPENVAKHLGTQNYYDFRLERNGIVIRVELKSLWGTDTTQCRLIHTKSRDGAAGKNSRREDRQVWRNSSCRFEDQDLFAVNMWLRTGQITDFAFALAVPTAIHPDWGLPPSKSFPEHVVQNIVIPDPPGGAWTTTLTEASDRLTALRDARPTLAEEIKALKLALPFAQTGRPRVRRLPAR